MNARNLTAKIKNERKYETQAGENQKEHINHQGWDGKVKYKQLIDNQERKIEQSYWLFANGYLLRSL